ncbi:uncharacterized protein [Diadema antillarum]|uniref:uncharacterized protein n=1 Tax=Diadema antillarum TaxID=105358 RepID=UPI003A8729C5
MTTTTTTTLRQTDFLPARFSGDKLDRDDATAHMLTFLDYLDAHNIDVTKPTSFDQILKTFKRTLQGQARLWIDGQTFKTFSDLREAFVRRFSPAKSDFANVHDFNTLHLTDGESTEAFLQRLRVAASYIDYGETQIRHRLLDSLPHDCRAAVLMSASTTTQTCDEIATKAQLYLDIQKDKQPMTKDLTFATQSEIDRLKDDLNSLKLDTLDQTRGRTRDRGRGPPHSRSSSRGRKREHSAGRSPYRSDRQYTNNRHRSHTRSPHPNDRVPHYTRRNDRRSIICDYCLIPGHVWRQCRKRLRDIDMRAQQQQQQQQHYYHSQHQHQQHYDQQPYYGPRPQDF